MHFHGQTFKKFKYLNVQKNDKKNKVPHEKYFHVLFLILGVKWSPDQNYITVNMCDVF